MLKRFKQRTRRWIMVAMIAAMALPMNAAFAQTAEPTAEVDDDGRLPGELEIAGVVQSFDGTTLVIGGISFDVSGAEVGEGIVPGTFVRVHASFDNGVWVAREAEVDEEDEADDEEDPIVDEEDESDDDDPVVDEEDESDDDDPIVDEEDESDDDDPVVDDEDESDDDSEIEEFELTGILEQIGDGFIVVGGQTINIAANLPNFEDDLVVGELVKVYVTLIEGELVGRDAELNPTDDEDEGDDDGGDYSCGDTPEGWTTYTVQSGDTLSGIAVRSDSDDDDLAEVNCIDDPSIIGIGDEILVPQEPEPQDVLDDDDLISEDEDEFDDDDDPVVDEEDESDDDDPVVDEEEDESDDDGDDDSEDEDESEDDDESDDDEEDSDEDE